MKLITIDMVRNLVVSLLLISFAKNVSASEKEENDRKANPLGVEGEALEAVEEDEHLEISRFVLPPYYSEKTTKYKLRVIFPFYFDKEKTGKEKSRSIGIMPFYWRHRSEILDYDVVFPFYSRFRGKDYKTDLVLQTFSNQSNHGYNFGFVPFLFLGKDTRDKSSYQIVPPLFWRFQKGLKSFLLAGIFYHKRNGDDFDLGLPPIFFAGRERYKSYKIVLPPLFFRFENEITYETKNILPPFFFNTRENGWSFGAMPLLYLARDRDWSRTMVIPFYYGSRWPSLDKQGEKVGEGKTYIFPLLLSYYRHAPGLSQGGAALFYQWYWNRGDYMKMFTPLVWMFGNDRRDENSLLIPPLFFRRTSPVRNDLMLGLIYWNFHQHYKERTIAVAPFFAHNWNLYNNHWRTWVFPTFDFGGKPNGGFHARLHPLFYYGKEEEKKHLVIAPIFWKFKDSEDDDLVVFPLYWQFKDLLHDDSSRIVFPLWWQFENPRRGNSTKIVFPFYWDVKRGKTDSLVRLGFPIFWQYRDPEIKTTGVLNIFMNRGKQKGNPFWTFNIFPFVSFGHPPSESGAYWSFLSGLVGWRRQGRSRQLKLFWIPINFRN